MKNKKLNSEILNDVYKNAHVAMQSISDLSPEIEDGAVKKHLLSEYETYKKIIEELSSYMEDNGIKPEDIGFFKKATMWSAVKMKTLTGTDNTKIANMMIKGATTGINDLVAIKNDGKMNEETENFVDKLLAAEEKSVKGWQKFL